MDTPSWHRVKEIIEAALARPAAERAAFVLRQCGDDREGIELAAVVAALRILVIVRTSQSPIFQTTRIAETPARICNKTTRGRRGTVAARTVETTSAPGPRRTNHRTQGT